MVDYLVEIEEGRDKNKPLKMVMTKQIIIIKKLTFYLSTGRQKIASLAHGLRLPERYREAGQRYYNLAVVNRFTRGRKSEHVAAVCLYAVCRSEKSAHMLIDFSDILQVSQDFSFFLFSFVFFFFAYVFVNR